MAADGDEAEVVGVRGSEDVASTSMYGDRDDAGSPEAPAHLEAQAAVADELDAARREYLEARAYTAGVDPAVFAAAERAEAEKRATLDVALKKSKRVALAKGREVAAILTRYHKLLSTRTLLRDVLGADGLSDGMLAAVIAPLSILLDFRSNHPRTVQPKSFKWAGRDVVLVPRPAPRVWTADDERGRHKETWKERGVFHKLQSLEAVNTTVFSDIHRQAKRHKAGEHESLLHIAYEVNAIHKRIEESRLADLPAVNELIFELGAHHRNAPSRFFEEHEAIREFMGFVRTEDLVTLDDIEVLEWDKKIVDVLKSQREQKFRADLTFALERLCLGQVDSLWTSAEERTADMIALQRRSERKKSEVTAEDLRTLDLYRLQLSFGIGDRFWVLWRDELRRAEQDEHAALKVCSVVKAWQALNGESAAAAAMRRMTRVVSELALERDEAGDDKQRLFNFIYSESTKQVAKDDVYKVGNEPMKLMNAMAAVQHFGWAWLLDTTVLTIFPADPRIRTIVNDVATWTKQVPPNDDKPLYIHSICRVMNHALSSVGVKFAYEDPRERRPKAYRVFLESGLPRFLASELSATLGYSQWVAFFSIAKHTCSRRCREGMVFCPNSFSVAEESSRLRCKLTAVNAKLVDPQRALAASDRDINHARKMLDALDHTPEALLSDEGRWARRLRELEQLVL